MNEYEFQDGYLTIMNLVAVRDLKVVLEKGTQKLFQVTIFNGNIIVAQVECDKISSDLTGIVEENTNLT